MQGQIKATAHELNPGSFHSTPPFFIQHLRVLTWLIIGAGVCLRLFHFFYNRSLWTDEAYLSNSIIRMDFLRLAVPPLEYEQKAPIGFLWMVKLCVLIFGKKEMALRLFPLICGIASLFVFKRVAGYFLRPAGILIAMAILAIGPPLVYYAVEAKQYATDLLATAVALYAYIQFHEKKDFPSLLLWGLWGAIIIWFSYPAIFILAGMAMALSLHHLFSRDWQRFFRCILPFMIWLLSFVINYLLFTQKHADSQWLILWFARLNSFMPLPPASLKDLAWFITRPLAMLHSALGLSWLDLNYSYSNVWRGIARVPLLPVACLLTGALVFFRHNRKHFLVLSFPFLLAMLASGLKMYPLFDRLFIFLAPLLILFIVRGYEQIMKALSAFKWKYAIPVLLLIGALGNSLYILINPSSLGRYTKNMTGRQALLYINERVQPGDGVYIYWNFEPIYRYYKEAYQLKYDAVVGQDVRSVSGNRTEYAYRLDADIDKLTAYKRVWLVYNKFRRFTIGDYTHQPAWYYADDLRPGEVVYQKLSGMGAVADTFQTREVRVNLFSLTK
jgi:hypothetical protein